MFTLLIGLLMTAEVEAAWQTDYEAAIHRAQAERKDLLIYFRLDGALDAVWKHPAVRAGLERFVCLRVAPEHEYQGRRLLEHGSLVELQGRPGIAVISWHDEQLPTHRLAISAHPFVRSRYGWVPDYGVEQVQAILDLPAPATLTQRSLIYAVRVHPDRPQSVFAEAHPAFLRHAAAHSARQAAQQHQHHADITSASARLRGEPGVFFSNGSEVVAESWGAVVGGETVLEAAFSCVDAWRHSSGHWSAVSRPHRYAGYDLARGGNGTWYATGIFGD